MKANISVILTIAIIFSCRSVRTWQNVFGEYSKRGNDYWYDLTLNKDSSFTLTQKYFEVNSSCHGKWQLLSNDTIWLKCEQEGLSEQLQSGYMSEREKKLLFLSKNKLKLGETILERK